MKTTHSAKVLADSIANGVRLVTFEVTFPRIILAEMNTHRVFSRCSASSRAIPIEKMIERAMTDPYVPKRWLANQRGMQGGEELCLSAQAAARTQWLIARDRAVEQATELKYLGIHKQWANRLLEPFLWHTAIISSTEWDNFYFQRIHPDAHPDMFETALAMGVAMRDSTPKQLYCDNEWHLPFIDKTDFDAHPEFRRDYEWKKVSVGRCARISYLNHNGVRDVAEDIALHDRMMEHGHMSPYEHVARPMREKELQFGTYCWSKERGDHIEAPFNGNFRGWVQYRKEIQGESNMIGFLSGMEGATFPNALEGSESRG
jgi:thymidylate synthase ThyX